VWQRRSTAHRKPLPQGKVLQSASAGSWQTCPVLVFTQLCPSGQSADVWQASWHLPMVHIKGWLQSLLSTHVAPNLSFSESPLQPAVSHDESAIRPRMRDADIAILQFRFQYPGFRAMEKYHEMPIFCD
jgi:hypothetical protein